MAADMSIQTEERTSKTPVLLDPGWLFVIAGLTLLLASVLIPAANQVREAYWQRDRALLVEQHRQVRLKRYDEFASALHAGEKPLVLALAASQLNQIPADRVPIGVGSSRGGYTDIKAGSASVFPNLEPDPIELPEFRKLDSTLSRMVSDDKTRPWILVVGAVLVFVGLLPASRRRG
ncbi:MAG: hypothetical protein JSS51_08390 [Planctomycetes bacterium]|nr:hypothetical protein [Planctomycetota bacterium]